MLLRDRYRRLTYWLIGLTALSIALAWSAESSLIGAQRAKIGPPPADLPFETIAFRSASGATLRGWFLAGEPDSGAIILLHGVRANRLAMLPRARWLHSLGYSVLLFDFQASGESTGELITVGYREALDATAAVSYMKSRLPHERIGVIGTSMGGAAALLAKPPLPIDALVIEQVYPSIDKAVSDRLLIRLGGATWLTPALLEALSWRIDVAPNQLRPIDHIAGLTVPKLLLAGDIDQHTPIDESLSMYAAAASPKEIWIVKGAQHVDLFHYDESEYRYRVGAFLNKWLRPQPAKP
ncbi:alpha/beta hydrolase [Dyella sp. 20L07]|uniref:alpha/beta hydrolase n=1 Tax=Dyella sp. 20L07 TaxID=3384240 RepID=UPI003D26978D